MPEWRRGQGLGERLAMYMSKERNRFFAEALFQHVRNTTTDQADELVEYDLSIFSDPDIAAREREKIFERLPMMALHSSQVAEPGSFMTVQLNRTNVIVTRLKDGSVKALVNACRHRGAAVCSEGSGKSSRFTCPYHGWTYGNEGRLLAISFADSFGLKRDGGRDLIELPAEERHGFIWIVENPDVPIDVAAHLGAGMDQMLAEYDLGGHFCYRSEIFEFDQNWKIMMDGLLDGYHVQFVHGATIRPYFYMNMTAAQDHGLHGVFATPRKAIDNILDIAPGQESLDQYAVFGNLFAPNSQFILHPHHIEYWTMYQDIRNPGRCRVHLRYLTPQVEYDAKGQEIIAKNWKIAVAAIVNEDVPMGNSIQRSADYAVKGSAMMGLNEVSNQLFHRSYQFYMNA